MEKQTMEFATVTGNGKIERIGRSVITQPVAGHSGKPEINWFDDSQLLRKGKADNAR